MYTDQRSRDFFGRIRLRIGGFNVRIAGLFMQLVKVRPNKAVQTDKVKLSRLLHSQEPRQVAFAAELGR